jgi:hypothetical protein
MRAKPIKENPTKRGGVAGGGGGRPTCPQGRKQAPNQPRYLIDPFPSLGGAAPSWLFLDKLKIYRWHNT